MFDVLSLVLVYTFVFGSLYLGMALGFTIISGVLRIFHLAYGALFLITAYGTWFFWKDAGMQFELAIFMSFVLVAIFAIIVYRFVMKPFIELEDYLLAALISVFIIVEEVINYLYPEVVGVYLPTAIVKETVKVGAANVPGQLLITAFVSIAMVVIYLIFFVKTKQGLIMRAISQDIFASKLVGVNFDRMYAIAMIVASIPPGVIILLISPVWALNPFIGWSLFTYAILVTVLGGLGNLKGSIMAAYIIGFIHAVVGFAIDPRMMLLTSLIVVILVLSFRPKGLARAETIW